MEEALTAKPGNKEPALHLLSGQTVGSSFVGMVHFLQTEKSDSTQSETAKSAEAQTTVKWGNFLSYAKG